jgi:hypothetical protein
MQNIEPTAWTQIIAWSCRLKLAGNVLNSPKVCTPCTKGCVAQGKSLSRFCRQRAPHVDALLQRLFVSAWPSGQRHQSKRLLDQRTRCRCKAARWGESHCQATAPKFRHLVCDLQQHLAHLCPLEASHTSARGICLASPLRVCRTRNYCINVSSLGAKVYQSRRVRFRL